MQHKAVGVALVWVLGMCCCSAVLAEDARSVKHPLYGYWESTVAETGCVESYWFKEDGSAVFTSGQEQLDVRYDVSPQPDAYGFFKLDHRVTLSNKAVDCTQQVSETHTTKTSYLLFQPDGNSFISCDSNDASLEACFGPMQLKNNADKTLP